MTLNEWVNAKVEEITREGARSATFDDAKTCRIGRRSTSIELFGSKDVPLDTPVAEVDRSTLPDDYSTKVPGIWVTINVVPPRCRKAVPKYFCLGYGEA